MEKMLTRAEVIEALGISRDVLRRSPRLRLLLPPVRLGHRTVRYRESDLIALVGREAA